MATTICMLPDDVLLEIFDHYRNICLDTSLAVWEWHLLAHVCRRWRQIIFDSPRRLDIGILCTDKTAVRKKLGIWPHLPIAVDYNFPRKLTRPEDGEDVIAALEHPDRVCYFRLRWYSVSALWLEKVVTMMQKPFPVLRSLIIQAFTYPVHLDWNAPSLCADFLGGSAPRLQEMLLQFISFPTLPTFLSSTSDLVTLNLCKVPPTGYISPEAMVMCLAALPRLKTFVLKFQSATSHPDRINLPPITRSVLPALTDFEFKGSSKYLEALVIQIDGPRLSQITIFYQDQVEVVQLSNFIYRSGGPRPILSRHARLSIFSYQVSFCLYSQEKYPSSESGPARTVIFHEGFYGRVAEELGQISSTTNVVHLKIEIGKHDILESIGDVEWQPLLHNFSTIRTLHVSRPLARCIALELEYFTWVMFPGSLPSLDLICLEGQSASSIQNFVAARQLSGYPVTVINTKAEFDERLTCYVST